MSGASLLRLRHGLINYICRYQSKISSSKKIDLQRDFAADVYHSLKTGDTVSHVVIFDPALLTIAPLTFSLVQLSPPLPVLLSIL
jgi:hypothetical protein